MKSGSHTKVASTKGYSKEQSWGIVFFKDTLVIKKVDKGGWIDKCTDLEQYIGWRIVKLNSKKVTDLKDLATVKKSVSGMEKPVIFTLQKSKSKDSKSKHERANSEALSNSKLSNSGISRLDDITKLKILFLVSNSY